MKMNKKETKMSVGIRAGALGAVMLVGVVLSAPVQADATITSLFRGSCHEVARDIHQLIQANPNSPCVGDLDMAAAHVDVAEMLLSRDKTWQALIDIEQASYELYDISVNRPYCALLAPNVKHILANLIRAKGEIEAYEQLNAMPRAVG